MTKERFLILPALALFALICAIPAHSANIKTHQKKVILNPGHDARAIGITTPTGLQEKDITLELAQLIADKLSETFVTTLIGGGNSSTETIAPKSPEQKAAFANKNQADLFIGIRLHHARPGTAFIFYYGLPDTGAADLWQRRTLKAQPRSRALATTIAAQLETTAAIRQPIVHHAPLKSLEGIAAPAILIEPFTASKVSASPTARKKFLEPYAQAIANAIRYFLKK